MRHRLETWLNQVWYGDEEPPFWLKGLVPLYRLGFLLDRWIKRRRQPAGLRDRSIVVVGNLTAGGSGKTPLVIRLCRLLQSAGYNPGVVSRGYGRQVAGLLDVTPSSDPGDTGDEPLVIARRCGVPVVVAADRCAAALSLFERGVDVVIADDGLQHHRLPRSVEICVIDGEREFGNGRMLPAGPLREPIGRLARCDFVVLNTGDEPLVASPDADSHQGPNKVPANLPGATVKMNLVTGVLHALDGDETWRLSQYRGCRVNAVAGIGNPERFFHSLRQAGLLVITHVFPDHHPFTVTDFDRLEPMLPIIMTEKDAVKCRAMNLKNAWYLSIDANLPASWEQGFLRTLAATQPMSEARR